MPSKYTNKLQGKRVLVLGGTSGIGFCVAENALENGAIVTIASSQQTSIDNALSRFRKSYPDLATNITGHTIDLRSDDAEASVLTLLDAITSSGTTPLDHIVSTAGDRVAIQPLSAFTGATALADFQRVRLVAPILLAKVSPGKYLRSSPESTLTFTGGVNTYVPGQGWTLPAAGGAALQGLVRALAVEVRPIRVNLVEPGATDTKLFSRAFTGEQLEMFKQKFVTRSLTGRMGSPEDVSEAYVYLMRDANITGQTVLTEGGLLLAPGLQR